MSSYKCRTFKVNITDYPTLSTPPIVTFDIDGDSTRDEVVEAFENFLKAIGYSWKAGTILDFVAENSEEICPSEEDTNRGIWTPHKSAQRVVTHLPEKCEGQHCPGSQRLRPSHERLAPKLPK